ncbi:MAG: GIY-YIG nuclease family protein [Methylocystis sp.]|uniref:GIY-YIG nuclease family protein n=1 Tax=Methylocystis sp. TaxID=1911079 RepID=UPI003DA53405
MDAPRPEPDEVVQGLETTSDKIRALARAGYLRSEISKFLDIRYQHVRKVLLDAGIEGGLKRNVQFERPPVEIESVPEVQGPTSWDALIQGGFQDLGEWLPSDDGEFELSAQAPTAPGVYAFVVDGWVRYVGLSQTGLRTRMSHYRRGHVRQKTSARVKGLIKAALAEGKQVKVLIAVPEEGSQWNGLPINIAAGLEAGLIRMIRPEWNILGAS